MESICFNCASREFAHRIEECARNREDVTLWGVDYMAYPLDADGEPIHVGDVIAYEDNTRPKEVVALVPPSVVIVDDGPRYADMCHHHAPTVEDVILDAISRCIGHSPEYWDKPIAECAAKLRMAGEDA